MSIVRFEVGDTLVFKKKHPCSSDEFFVTKGGTDIKIVCKGCQRTLCVSREKAEKMIKRIIRPSDEL